jgi:hypothetical protein
MNTFRSIGIVAILVALGAPLPAQSGTGQSTETVPRNEHSRIVRGGMTVLGSWAATNLAAGTVGALTSDNPRVAGFWEMNALWNTVNLGLAGTTLIVENRRTDPTGTTDLILPAYREESHRLEKTLLFNAGLDIGYMTLGGWLWERGARGDGLSTAGVSAERLAGWGQALVLQGAFLFILDVVLARRLATNRRSLR